MENVHKNYVVAQSISNLIRGGLYLTDVEEGGGSRAAVLKEKGSDDGGKDEGLDPEGVQLTTVGGTETEPGVVQDGSLGSDKQTLHQEIIDM